MTTTYLNYDVLDQMPDSNNARTSQNNRILSVINNNTGKRYVDDKVGLPVVKRDFVWTAFDRPSITALKAFISARKGMAVPVWLPTRTKDLVSVNSFAAGDTALLIKDINYSSYMFLSSGARRHIAFLDSVTGQILAIKKVISAARNLDGTETLNIDSPSGVDGLNNRVTLSFLVLCRLDSDTVEIKYETPFIASASLSFTELPHEAPT